MLRVPVPLRRAMLVLGRAARSLNVTARSRRVAAVLAMLALVPAVALASSPAKPAAAAGPPLREELYEAKAPPFSDGIFPCMQCHDTQQNPARRELAFHDEQQAIFDHDREHRWCLDCHDLANRDVLRLASGATVPFTESYRLCGQCHGDKYRDWRAGVHGKRVGRWDGAKTYFLCVNCHNPHSPAFKGVREIVVDGKPTVAPTLTRLKPEPAPIRPGDMRSAKARLPEGAR